MVDTLYQVPSQIKTVSIGSYTSVVDHFVEELLVQLKNIYKIPVLQFRDCLIEHNKKKVISCAIIK